jgi:formylglycine-generating enzyme required for sulfatase activity
MSHDKGDKGGLVDQGGYARHTTALEVSAFDDTVQLPQDLLPIDNLPPSYVLEGRYEVLSVLGRGGFGVVYKARQRATGQLVAVKVLLNKQDDLVVQARFTREMTLIGRLNHPYIVRLIDSGKLSEGPGHLFAVLEFIEGESIAERIQRVGPLGVALTRRLMTQALEALAYAHGQGVIHRDLKPQNIMVTGDGALAQARVLDFGLAAVAKEARAEDYLSLTGTHQLHGTPGYMSPEQLTNGELTPRIDLYAMGLVFVECLVGQPVIQASSLAAMIFLQMSKEALPLPEPLLATPLGPLLASMTAKNHAERPADAEQVLAVMGALDWQHPTFAVFEAWALTQAGDAAGAASVGLTDDTLRSGRWFDSAHPARPPGASAALSRRWTASARWMWSGLVGGAVALAVAAWWVLRAPQPTTAGASAGGAGGAGAQVTQPTTPTCAVEGQVAVGAGRCCWPGQAWDDLSGRCEGEPARCPPSRYAHGADCVTLQEGQRNTATLVIPPSEPPGAQVEVNGADMGAAPLLLEGLPLGDVSITYRMEGRAEVLQFASLDRDAHTATLAPAALPPLQPGVPPDMVWVPAGPSWQGCAPIDLDAAQCDERDPPGGYIDLPSFAIDHTEVTVGAFRRCVEEGGCAAPSEHPSKGDPQRICHWAHAGSGFEHHPINCITWTAATQYCAWRGRRLPSSAEWEKAARGPTPQAFPWGDAPPTCEVAVISSPEGSGCGRNNTWPVASRPLGVSPYGAFDMLGNVAEWTADPLPESLNIAKRRRIVRGNDFDDSYRKLRISRIDHDDEADVDNDLGFRCALSVAAPPPDPQTP